MGGASWVVVLIAANAAAPSRPPAPHPACLDARTVTEARHLDERQVLLRIGEARYRLELTEACPARPGEPLLTLAPHGWLCGGAGERLRVGDRTCGIARVAALDERDWALTLREHARKHPVPTLAPVTVDAKSQPKRRFAASPEYCIDPRRMRGWNASGSDIVIETKPRRGSRESPRYRLEFAGGCPQAGVGTELTLISGMGMGWICGNPGDRAVIADAWSNGFADADAFSSPLSGGFIRGGCLITAVYPE